MIKTRKVESVEIDSLLEWMEEYVQPLFPGKEIMVIPNKPHDATGESRFFCALDIDRPCPLSELKNRVVKEYSEGNYIYLYPEDVLSAAAGSGHFRVGSYYLYYRW